MRYLKNCFENFLKKIWAIFICDICGYGKFFWAWHSVFDTGVVKISFPTLGQGTFPTLDLIKVISHAWRGYLHFARKQALSRTHAWQGKHVVTSRYLIDSFACLPLTLPTVISYDLYAGKTQVGDAI